MWRDDFPLFRNSDLVYLDSGASTQKPQCVIDTVNNFYTSNYSNVHRGIYPLSENATTLYEGARNRIAQFINAQPEETIVVPSTTGGLNLLAYSLFKKHIQPGDTVLVTVAEHHANFVPWQQLSQAHGVHFQVIPLEEDGTLSLSRVSELLHERVKVVACTQVSNVLGNRFPIRGLAELIHRHGAYLVVDGAQSVPHLPVDVKELDADFLVFSGHKIYGPTGVGILYGRRSLLEELPPFLYGGDMIQEVHEDYTLFNELPCKFEAGTPPIAQLIGLGEAVKYVDSIGFDAIQKHEENLMTAAFAALRKIPGATIYGPGPEHRTGGISFTLEGIHPHDIAGILGDEGVSIRAGHHCAQPLHTHLGAAATARVSFGLYNTLEDIDRFISALKKAKNILSGAA